MDNAHLTKYTPDKQGQYYVLDTTISPTMTATVDAMTGRQGDTLRKVPIAFVDDSQPHDLTNSSVELRVQDAAGVVKISDNVVNYVSRTGGLITFGIPAKFYTNPGEVQHAYFVITDKDGQGNATSTSTVNVDFSVVEDGIEVTAADTHIYISSVDRMLETTKDRIQAVKLMGDNAESQIRGYQDMLQSHELPTRQGDNDWTGTNSFKSITTDKLTAPELDSLSAALVTVQTTANAGSIAATSTASVVSGVTSSGAVLSTSVGSAVTSMSTALSTATASVSTAIAQLSDTQSSVMSSVSGDVDALSNKVETIESQVDHIGNAGTETPDYSYSLSALSSAVSSVGVKAGSASDNAETAIIAANGASQQVASLSSAVNNLKFEADRASDDLSYYDLTSMSTAIAILQSTIKSAQSAGKL